MFYLKEKIYSSSCYIILLALFLISCNPDKNNQETNITGQNSNSNFSNDNIITHRLEFPHLRGGNNIILTHKLSDGEVNYSVEWDGDKKSNRWTCYQQYASNRAIRTHRWRGEPQYPSDPLLPTSMSFTEDLYWYTGYDHGHLCPSADRLSSSEANRQTFYLTNMQPQAKKFNGSDPKGGIWLTMENKMRASLNIYSNDTMFICRGGTIDNESQIKERLRGGLIVPGYFFSTAILKYYNYHYKKWEYKPIAFWFKHEDNQDSSLAPYIVSIDELEKLTGIDFFCNLPDNIEKQVEAVSKENIIKLWNIK